MVGKPPNHRVGFFSNVSAVKPGSSESTHRFWTLAVISGITVFAVIAFVDLDHGHDWGGDFSLYISHAINLATGQPYAETNYLPNPLYLLSQTTYPPGTPFILAPVYAIFGLNLVAMKTTLLLIFCATMLLVFFFYREYVGHVEAGLITAAMLLNPYAWQHKNQVLSEFVFMFFLFLSLLILERREKVDALRGRLVLAVCAGMVTYFAFATRDVGIVLVPAVLLYDLLRHHKIKLDTVAFVGVFVAAVALQSLLLGFTPDEAFGDAKTGYNSILYGWGNVVEKLRFYVFSLRNLFPVLDIPYAKIIFAPIIALLCVSVLLGVFREWTRFLPRNSSLGAAGVLAGLARGIRLQDIVAVGYFMALILQPFSGGTRYMLPLAPIIVFLHYCWRSILARPCEPGANFLSNSHMHWDLALHRHVPYHR